MLLGPNWSPLSFNPIPTGLCHVITVYGLIQPIVGRNRVDSQTRVFRPFLKTSLTKLRGDQAVIPHKKLTQKSAVSNF